VTQAGCRSRSAGAIRRKYPPASQVERASRFALRRRRGYVTDIGADMYGATGPSFLALYTNASPALGR
jgi:hypothetical protein